MDVTKYKAILFDHDGTIVDSEQVHYELWLSLIGTFANQFTEEMYANNCVGVPTESNIEYLFSCFALQESPESLLDRKRQATKRFLETSYFPLLEGVKDFMQFLHIKNRRMAVVSGSERFAVLRSVSGNKLEHFIELVATGDQVENNKPEPDVYNKALFDMQLDKSECLAIEDTFSGVSAARAAGIDCIAIPNPHTLSHDFSAATLKLNNIVQLHELFERAL
ncbi:MAG: HAD-IA family hydrolase [Alteromonadaceae bacterium]|nr:HAD-IA family hydrolase [Alteromonadaceae bacterium]